MKSLVVLLFAFVALCYASPKRSAISKENKEIRNKIMNFNYDLDEFLDKIRYDKNELLDGQPKSITKDAEKFLNCITEKDVQLIDSVRNALSRAYKFIIKKELNTTSYKSFCNESGSAKNVTQRLQKCIDKPRFGRKLSNFLEDLYLVIDGTYSELCPPNNLEYKLAVFERFREEIGSDYFKSAFKRYEELLHDCTKLKVEDHCLPLTLADAFETKALESQVFTEKSRRIFKTLAHIYYTTAIKVPYKQSEECENKEST